MDQGWMDYTRYHPQIKCEGTETMSKTKRKKIRKRKSRGKEIPRVVMRRAGRYKGNLFQMSRVPHINHHSIIIFYALFPDLPINLYFSKYFIWVFDSMPSNSIQFTKATPTGKISFIISWCLKCFTPESHVLLERREKKMQMHWCLLYDHVIWTCPRA